MRRLLLCIVLGIVVAAPAAGAEVVLRDGTVIDATSYTLTGSYLMLTLPDGRQVAYDVVDVDIEALKAQEAANAPEPEPVPEPVGDSMMSATADSGQTASLTLTDQDVEHVGRTGQVTEEEDEENPAERPGFMEGGQVGLQGLKAVAAGPGEWEAQGEVINRTGQIVGEVRVQLQAIDKDGKVIANADVPVTSVLEPNLKAVFSHTFAATEEPTLKARVFWMAPDQPAGAEPAPTPAAEGGGAAGEVYY